MSKQTDFEGKKEKNYDLVGGLKVYVCARIHVCVKESSLIKFC